MKPKAKKFIASIVIDLIGAAPTIIGIVGVPVTGALSFVASESFDIVWAPIQSALIYWMYKDWTFTAISFAEEILPFTDIVPTATLTWIKHET